MSRRDTNAIEDDLAAQLAQHVCEAARLIQDASEDCHRTVIMIRVWEELTDRILKAGVTKWDLFAGWIDRDSDVKET